MELNELKLTCAGNLINLRTRSNITQADLGAMLNYSDKNISKWERGESLPDAFALVRLSKIFGVPVDYILTPHDTVDVPEGMPVETNEPTVRASMIITVTVLSIMTCTLTAFVIMWLLGNPEWRVFLIGISISLLATMILDGVFYKWKGGLYIIAAFVLSLFFIIYFAISEINAWQLFLIAIPAVAIVFVSGHIKIKPVKLKINKIKKKK